MWRMGSYKKTSPRDDTHPREYLSHKQEYKEKRKTVHGVDIIKLVQNAD
jgi:hypothetical protein